MMDTLFGKPEDDISGPVKRLKWALSVNDQNKEPIHIDEEFETQLIRGRLPELNQLLNFCQSLNINLDWLFFNHGQPFRSERHDDEMREMINFANQRKEFRHSLLAKFYELKALYKV